MPRKQENPEAEVIAEKKGVSALAVYDNQGRYIRTYSAQEHGANFIELAEGFAKKKGGEVRKAS